MNASKHLRLSSLLALGLCGESIWGFPFCQVDFHRMGERMPRFVALQPRCYRLGIHGGSTSAMCLHAYVEGIQSCRNLFSRPRLGSDAPRLSPHRHKLFSGCRMNANLKAGRQQSRPPSRASSWYHNNTAHWTKFETTGILSGLT